MNNKMKLLIVIADYTPYIIQKHFCYKYKFLYRYVQSNPFAIQCNSLISLFEKKKRMFQTELSILNFENYMYFSMYIECNDPIMYTKKNCGFI